MTWSNRNQNNTTNYQHPNESNLWELHKAMGYDPQGNPIIRIDDTSLQHTSKDRAKVSGYEIVFFNTFQFDKEDDVWDEFTTAGGTSTHDPNARECHLIVDGSIPGAKVIRQTKNVQRYIPGRTTEASFAVVFGHNEDPGIVKRFGVYDENNGLFVEVIGNTIALVIRSDANGSIVEKRIPQAEWNQDVLNGTGRTGITLNLAMRQIILFEYEWYGAGVAELKFVKEIHIIAVNNEVKELLYIIEKGYDKEIKLFTINESSKNNQVFDFYIQDESKANSKFATVQKYLYEPNAAIMKSGAFNLISDSYKLEKLHPNSHLYTSHTRIDFPGRVFKVMKVLPYNKRVIKSELSLKKINISTRNFPESIQIIKKRYKIKDGGEKYVFFTTDFLNKKLLIFTEKA
jgi:hypothetical protein